MSVQLTVIDRSGAGRDAYVPISGQLAFRTFWKPLATALKLGIVEQFEPGVPIDESNYDPLMHDLDTLENHCVSAGVEPSPLEERKALSSIAERTQRLREALIVLKGRLSEFDVFIG